MNRMRWSIFLLLFIQIYQLKFALSLLCYPVSLKKSSILFISSSNYYSTFRSSKLYISFPTQNSEESVESGISLKSLDNIVEDSAFLGSSIKIWLDSEFIVQPIHDKIAERVSSIYKEERFNGNIDLGEMMMNVGTSLESFDMQDAFVSAWDVANKVSDLLIFRMNRELCSCSGDMSIFVESAIASNSVNLAENYKEVQIINEIKKNIDKVIKKYNSLFERYKFLRKFLDDEIEWQEMYPIIAIILGYRWINKDGDRELIRDSTLAPLGWTSSEHHNNNISISDFSDITNTFIRDRLESDLPLSDEAVDMVLENIVGTEIYLQMKVSTDLDTQRRILMTKWLYTVGFLGDSFPATESFTPGHRL